MLFRNEPPEIVTRISLTVVFCNALSGTIAYARPKRIDYKIGVIFSLATMPGAVLGALAATAVSGERFDLLFGFLLLAIAIVLVISPGKESATRIAQSSYRSSSLGSLDISTLVIGALVSTEFGFLSSFLGNRRRHSLCACPGISVESSGSRRHGHVIVRSHDYGVQR